jgi:adenosylcobinamide-GDP ribazoletransferase
MRLALAMFTVLPVPGAGTYVVDRTTARRAVLWLPIVGAALGVAAALPAWGITQAVDNELGALLGAATAITVLALATRGLHLDGLADTADGLGSHAESERALAIMRQPDIGAFGVAAIAFTLLLQTASLAVLLNVSPLVGAAAVVCAAFTGRLTVVLAAGRNVKPARPEGFGALVAGSLDPRLQVAYLLLAVAIWLYPRPAFAAAAAAGLVVADLFRRHAVRRLGGITGDVFGALVELGTTAALLTAAVAMG